MKKLFAWGGLALGLAIVLVGVANIVTNAQQEIDGGFALQLTPSPLVTTVKPGESKQLELNIRNEGAETEKLQIKPREFTVNKETGEIKLKETIPAGVSDWVKFSEPVFTIGPGKVFTQKISITLPVQSGFSYSFALVISRVQASPTVEGGAALSGSVAVFTLINVDRPGATRQFDITDFSATAGIFEYLPAEFEITFRNTGNTIIQPSGNVFIQRGSNDTNPITTLPVNNYGGYLLPDSPRTLRTQWTQGFPSYVTKTGPDGQVQRELMWDWTKLPDFRIGQYTAKVVAFYNDGERDVPIIREVTFWVFPWRAVLFLIAVVALIILIAHKLIQLKTKKAVKKALDDRDKKKTKSKKKT